MDIYEKKLGFGTMRLPLSDPKDETKVDIKTYQQMADAFIKEGFVYFDTAKCYHINQCEPAFRLAVADRYPRDSYSVTGKLSLFMMKKAEEMEGFFESQLKDLGISYFDIYLLHCLSEANACQVEEWGVFSFLVALKEKGLTKHIGFSYHGRAELLEETLKVHPEVEYVQLQLNYLDWDSESVQSEKCLKICQKYGKKVLVMEPVKGGALVNIPEEAEKMFKDYDSHASTASWAIRFAASQKNVVMVLSGMSDPLQMADNMSYMKDFKPLSEAEMDCIKKAAKIIKSSIAIPCTACRYCIEGCPKDIPIPDYFSIYNNLKRFGDKQKLVAGTYYENLSEVHGKASQCIKCGKCEKICPQHLKVREYLEKVVEEVEHM